MKHQLKDVIHYYLPYEIEIRAKIEDSLQFNYTNCDIVSVNMLSKCLTIRHIVGLNKDEEYITDKEFHQIKPLLRPLSDLTKEIEHQREKFVPMIKLFEMIGSVGYVDYNGDLNDPKLQIDDGWNHVLSYGDIMTSEVSLSYDKKGSFSLMVDQDVQIFSEQFRLFQKLLEWHFDIFDLHTHNQCVYYKELDK